MTDRRSKKPSPKNQKVNAGTLTDQPNHRSLAAASEIQPPRRVEEHLPGSLIPAAGTERGDTPSNGGVDLEVATACLSGLTGVLETLREDVRSLRVMLASNLILIFTIPIATLSVQDRYVFLERLPIVTFWSGVRFYVPHAVILLWLSGVMVFGATLPTLLGKKRSESTAEREIERSIVLLTENDVAGGVQKLSNAIRFYIVAIGEAQRVRTPFILSFCLFALAIAIEFGLYLFAPLRSS